jgi:hypothetical protein
MGLVKRQLEEDWERGWSSGGDKYVCDIHVEDEALVRLIGATAESTTCSYCDRTGTEPFAAPLDVVIERIAEGLMEEWRNADDEGVGWDGGYVGAMHDTWDLLFDVIESPLNHEQLMGDVIAALPEHNWAQRDYYRPRPHLRMRYGWEQFGEIVKHRRRYFFADHADPDDEGDPDFIAPGAMLETIGDAVRDARLVRQLPSGTVIWRVRSHKADETPSTASDIGATPAHLITSSSRMSPAGVPLFYGALDEDTAIVEAQHANPNAEALTLGTFRLLRPAHLVDLAQPPVVPSLFDAEDKRRLRQPLIFLRSFTAAVSEPFERDDRIHIEYVPTQVVTEWLRTRFDPGPNGAIDAVAYGSARRPGGVNLAIFIDNGGARDRGDGEIDGALLELAAHRRL